MSGGDAAHATAGGAVRRGDAVRAVRGGAGSEVDVAGRSRGVAPRELVTGGVAPWQVVPREAAPCDGALSGVAPSEAELLARVAWSIVAEPGDATAGAVVRALGARTALSWAAEAVRATPADGVRRLRRLVREAPRPRDGRGVGPDGGGARSASHGGPGGGEERTAPRWSGAGPDLADDRWSRVVGRALERWAPRFDGLDPARALDTADAVGAVVLVPGYPGWPDGLDDLGAAAPLALWVRGRADLAGLLSRAVAVVGARAATVYGRRVASDIAGGLAANGVTVVSGGAFGIDVAAHRAALAAGGPTVALLAGGIDRPSPAGNLDVLEALAARGGALVAESPPGSTPTRSRFLQRNRLIAAGTGATVVVEAAWRSGALSTAARAAELLRPVGVVPGPVTSMASAGCHRLLRDGSAVCVTAVDEVLELVSPVSSGQDIAPSTAGASRGSGGAGSGPGGPSRGSGGAGSGPGGASRGSGGAGSGSGGASRGSGGAGSGPGGPSRGSGGAGSGPDGTSRGSDGPGAEPGGSTGSRGPRSGAEGGRAGHGRGVPPVTSPPVAPSRVDRADSVESRVLDAVPRAGVGVTELARRAGLAVREVQAALGLLELGGLVERVPGGWRRAPAPRRRVGGR